MTIDKDKIAKNALRFIQKGQFQKAIEEYRKALSADPRDIRTRLKLVDLYGRSGKKNDAIDECLQVAESYADQGFYLKAIAVYKQALRIDPENPALYRSVGELYVKQGLIGDALAAFKRGVDILRAQGQSEEAEELLRRMEEMAPENAAIKIHLAELYLSEGRHRPFEEQLAKIVLQLKGEGRTGKLLQAVETFYEKSNHHPSVLRRLAELYADLHEEEKALRLVQEGLARDAGDRDLRLAGLRANLTVGNVAEARQMALGLYEQDPHDLFILEQLASIAQAQGDSAEEARAYKAMAKVYEAEGVSEKRIFYYRKVLEISPDDPEGRLAVGEVAGQAPRGGPPEAAAVPSPPRRDETSDPAGADPLQDDLVEAELYLKYGLADKAAEKLQALAEKTPDDVSVRQRLRDLYQQRGDRAGWTGEQLRIGEIHLRQGRDSEALRAYQAILEADPQNAEARQAVLGLRPETTPHGGDEIAIDVVELPAEPADAQAEFPVSSPTTHAGEEPEDKAAAAREEFVDLQAEVLDAHPGLGRGLAGFRGVEVQELDDIVREFKSGIAEKLGEGDYETHYNLGLAYREMGLLDDAVQEFQIAARFPEKSKEAYTSIALVYRETERREEARAALRMALAVPTNTPEDRAAILYELGELWEADGDWEGALRAFDCASEIDPAYRDLPRRVQALRARGPG